MSLKEYVAISGLPGLFKVISSRANGLVAENIDSGKTRFYSMRKHQFTLLETVAIYTDTDSTELLDVFREIQKQATVNPPPLLSSSNADLFAYFETILPNFDKDRVLISDVKKVIKWYTFLSNHNLLNSEEEE